MPIIVLKNPKSFARECEGKNITLDLLNEAKMCIGAQTVCKMFIGKSSRGDEGYISASSLDTWIATLNFVKNNPDKEDGDRFSGARMLEKYGDAWDKYVAFIKTPISDETVNSWENLSNVKLGDAASAVGITMGIRNFKIVKSLRTRLYDMVKRRKELFWDRGQNGAGDGANPDRFAGGQNGAGGDLTGGGAQPDPSIGSKGLAQPDQKGACEPTGIVKVDYKFNNTFTLHKMCKNRGIVSAKLTKDKMITLLMEDDLHRGSDGANIPVPSGVELNYEKMKIAELKNIYKEKKLNNYNKLNKHALITALVGVENTSTNTTFNSSERGVNKNLVLTDITDPVSPNVNSVEDLKYQNELLIKEICRLKEIIKSTGVSV